MAEYAATIAGLISLGLTVCEGLTKYYSAAKSHVKDIKDIISQLRVLTNILQVLQSTVETSDFTLSPAFQLVLSNIENCRDGIKELEQHKALLQPLPTTVGVVKGSFQKAIYPFRKHQLESLKTTLDRLNSQLSLACHASHMQQLQFLTTLSEKTFSHITSATISAPTAQGPGSTQQTAKDVSFNDQKMQATYSTTHCACRARYINGNQWTSYYVSLWSFQQSRHHPSCPRYDSRSDVNNWGLRLVIPLLWTSGQQYMSIDVRVGRGSRPFTLICQRMVPMTNEAFALVDRWATERWRVKSAAVCCSELARARHGLRLALENGSIFPNDTLLDGSNLLHRTLKLVRYVSFFHVGDDDEEMYEQALALVRTVIRVGVPLDERDIFGESPIDNVIQCQYRNNQITTAARYSRDIEFRARLLSLFKDRCSASADVSDRSHVWELSLLKSETSVLEDFLGPGLEQAVLRTDIRALQSALQPLSTSDSEHRASILLAANIACESDWAQGLAVLFDHGLTSCAHHEQDLPPGTMSLLEQSLKSGSLSCTSLLLQKSWPIFNPTKCLELALVGDTRPSQLRSKHSLVEMYVLGLKTRRRSLVKLATTCLPMHLLEAFPTIQDDEVVLDVGLEELFRTLHDCCVDVPLSLVHTSYDNIYLSAGTGLFTCDTADLLWKCGFRSMPSCSDLQHSLFLTKTARTSSIGDRHRYLERQLSVATWLERHDACAGGAFDDHIMLLWAAQFAHSSCCGWYEVEHGTDCRFAIDRDSLPFLKRLLLAKHYDSTPCGCSSSGCTGIDRSALSCIELMLASMRRMSGAEPTDDQLVAILKHVAMLLSPLLAGMDQMRQQLEAQVLRSLLFARLRLRHVCCPVARITCVEVLNSRNIDPDTWQPQDEQIKLEILEEDESIRKDFEVLLADIYDNMQKSGKKFEEWFMANFESRARLSIVALDPVDAEYVKTVQHLGVRVQPHGHSI